MVAFFLIVALIKRAEQKVYRGEVLRVKGEGKTDTLCVLAPPHKSFLVFRPTVWAFRIYYGKIPNSNAALAFLNQMLTSLFLKGFY